MKRWTKKEWLVSWVLNIYIGFLFVFFWSKLQESEKKNLELLTDIERLKKETEELRSEKGMATDIQITYFTLAGISYQLSVISQVKYDTKGFWHTKCEHTYCTMRCIHSSYICTSHMYPFCWYTSKSKVLSGLELYYFYFACAW